MTGTGKTATITQDGVNVRLDASTAEDAVAEVNGGDTLTITGEVVEAEGLSWYPVELANGTKGFIMAEFLDIAP